MDMWRATTLFRSYPLRSKKSARRLVALSHVMAAMSEQGIMHLCATINDELARTEVPYLLRMSIGYARVGDGVDTWQDLLRAADAELYRVKREKKKAGVQIR